MSPMLPVPAERAGGSQAGRDIASIRGPAQRGSNVVALPVEVEPPGSLFGSGTPDPEEEPRVVPFSQIPEMLGVATTELRLLAGPGQLLGRVFPDRLEHREPWLALHELDATDEARIHQGARSLQDVELRAGATHGVSGFEGPPAREHGEAGEEHALVWPEQVVAPLDRPAQRPVTLRNVAGTAGQQR